MMTLPYPFARILIPYDGSPSAQKALEWAAHLARAGGDEVEQVTLLRVIGRQLSGPAYPECGPARDPHGPGCGLAQDATAPSRSRDLAALGGR